MDGINTAFEKNDWFILCKHENIIEIRKTEIRLFFFFFLNHC